MKNFRLFTLLITMLMIVITSCSKIEDEPISNGQMKLETDPGLLIEIQDPGPGYFPQNTWIEKFDSPFFEKQWTLYGNPKPQWVQSAYGAEGLFDNNGPSPIKNYAVSKATVGRGSGYSVEAEVRVQLLNNNENDGTCICPGIAVSKEKDPVFNWQKQEIETGISMRIVYVGPNAVWFPSYLRNHTWLIMDYMGTNDELIPSDYLPADQYLNKWIDLRLTVTNSGNVIFSCNDVDIWKPFEKIHPDMKTAKNVVLGYTSAGDLATRAGVAYHNWVKGSYVIGPEE